MNRTLAGTSILLALAITPLLSGCGSGSDESPAPTQSSEPLPDAAYYMETDLEPWVDPETGYDTTRDWEMKGGEWPIMLVMSPSQSPQLLVGSENGVFDKLLAEHRVTPVVQKLDGPARVFHAMERSQWPFVYMPIAVFMDYARSEENQGDAGGLQYVLLAGSTAGGGYLLMAPKGIDSVGDLADKTVGIINSHPVPGTLLQAEAAEHGLELGDGKGEIHVTFDGAAYQLNAFAKGELDAVVSFAIYRQNLEDGGAQVVTDFADTAYTPAYTVLAVERTVLEERPEVVDAFLRAHLQGDVLARQDWENTTMPVLYESWNGFFESEDTPWAPQRIAASQDAFAVMHGDIRPEVRLDRAYIGDMFAFNDEHGTWGWDGEVDLDKLVDYGPMNEVFEAHGEAPQ